MEPAGARAERRGRSNVPLIQGGDAEHLRRFWHEQSIACQPQPEVSHPLRQAVAATVCGAPSALAGEPRGWHRLFGTGIATDSLGMLMWGPEKVLEAAPAQPHG